MEKTPLSDEDVAGLARNAGLGLALAGDVHFARRFDDCPNGVELITADETDGAAAATWERCTQDMEAFGARRQPAGINVSAPAASSDKTVQRL